MKIVLDSKLILRIVCCFVSVIIMGFSLSWLIIIDLGTDPCSVMNLGVSNKLGISFGNWQLIYNILLLFVIIIFERKMIGIGTIFNMVLVGYSCDFFSYFWGIFNISYIAQSMFIRIIIMVVALGVFVVAAATYMMMDIGVSPYDAIPFIIYKKQSKLRFKIVRIMWDMFAVVIGGVLGSTVGIVTVIVAFLLGPVIEYVKPYINRIIYGSIE